jgi:hypothetical protein
MLITQIFQNNKKLGAEKGQYGFYPDIQQESTEPSILNTEQKIREQASILEAERLRIRAEFNLLAQQYIAIGVPAGMVQKFESLVNATEINSQNMGTLQQIYNNLPAEDLTNDKNQNITLKRQIGFVRNDLN